MNLTKFSRPCSHFGTIFQQEEGKRGIVKSITLYHFTSHSISEPIHIYTTVVLANLVPRLFLRGRKDPGRSWSRATQILGGKLKQHLGRGGRVLRLENYNLCA